MKTNINDRINLNALKIKDGRTFLQWLQGAAVNANGSKVATLESLKNEFTPILKDIVKI